MVTEVEHDLKEKTKVDGFQEPGSFSQQVTYHASEEVRIYRKYSPVTNIWPFQVIGRVVETAVVCRQPLTYFCRNSKLLNSQSNQYQVHCPFYNKEPLLGTIFRI